MPKLDGKTAIVTGGTSGMGRAIAELFAAEGASIVIGGRDEGKGLMVERAITSRGGRASFVSGNVGAFETNEHLVGRAVERFGGLDILVPNAGILGLGSITELSLEAWHETVAANLNSVFYLLKLGIPEMLRRGGGAVIINGSIAAFKGFPRHPAYCATKAAMTALVKQVSVDYAPAIRINLLCPGPVDTPLIWDSARAFPNPETAVAEAAQKTLLKRLGTPLDIAKAALFFASEDSSWITGSALVVDGGVMCAG